MKKLLLLPLLAIVLVACQNLNRSLYNAEKLAADTGASSVHVFNEYYHSATNGVSAEKLASLNRERDQVYDASRKLSAALTVADNARLNYAQNKNSTNQIAAQVALAAVTSQGSNIAETVKFIIGK